MCSVGYSIACAPVGPPCTHTTSGSGPLPAPAGRSRSPSISCSSECQTRRSHTARGVSACELSVVTGRQPCAGADGSSTRSSGGASQARVGGREELVRPARPTRTASTRTGAMRRPPRQRCPRRRHRSCRRSSRGRAARRTTASARRAIPGCRRRAPVRVIVAAPSAVVTTIAVPTRRPRSEQKPSMNATRASSGESGDALDLIRRQVQVAHRAARRRRPAPRARRTSRSRTGRPRRSPRARRRASRTPTR